jgi:hypothetical protein
MPTAPLNLLSCRSILCELAFWTMAGNLPQVGCLTCDCGQPPGGWQPSISAQAEDPRQPSAALAHTVPTTTTEIHWPAIPAFFARRFPATRMPKRCESSFGAGQPCYKIGNLGKLRRVEALPKSI